MRKEGMIFKKLTTAFLTGAVVMNAMSLTAFAQDGVVANGTTVTVNEDVHATGYNEQGVSATGSADVTVNGNVTSDTGYGVYSQGSSVTVNGDVNGDDLGVRIDDKETGSDVMINGDVEGGFSGVDITTETTTNVTVNGDITGTNDQTGTIWHYNLNADSTGALADILNGELNLNVTGDVSAMTPNGVGMGLGMDGENAKANVVIDGTVSGTRAGIVVWYSFADSEEDAVENYNRPDITVWEIEEGTDGYIVAEDGPVEYESLTEEILTNVDYIIRVSLPEGLEYEMTGTTEKDGHQVAKEGQEVTIMIVTQDVTYENMYNGSAALVRNEDGSFTLIVPRGGGVDISDVMKAIETNTTSVPVYETQESAPAPAVQNVPAAVAVEEPEVMGAVREDVAVEEPAVLGARRDITTGDVTGIISAVLMAMSLACGAVSMVYGRKMKG